jgi:uncharacterized protein (TIGR02145 family)
MKKILYTIFFIIGIQNLTFSQGEWNNWYFGVNAAMTFNSGVPLGLTGSPMVQSSSTTSITVSDSSGNLLFFSNGMKVFNRNYTVMPNSNFLFGGSGSGQNIVAIPKINDPGKYFLFTVGSDADPPPLRGCYYSLLDMQLDGGLGDIVSEMKNIPLHDGDSAVNMITAVRSSNNKDAWVVVLRSGKPKKYLAYHVTQSGIDTVPVISNTALRRQLGNLVYASRTLRISQNGHNMACTDSVTEISYFNDTTGAVSPRFTIPYMVYGSYPIDNIEFSPKARFLYTSSTFSYYSTLLLFQFDCNAIDSAQFMQSMQIVGSGAIPGTMHLGPDFKIYVGSRSASVDSLSVINNPDIQGIGCNLQNNAVALLGNWNGGSIPQFLQRYKAYINYTGNCQNKSIHFLSDIWPPIDSVLWNFGDPSSGLSNFSDHANSSHIYSSPGSYTVELFVRHIDNRTDTSWQTITIIPGPQVTLGADRTICIGDSTTFDAGACTGCTYLWKNIVSGDTVGTSQTFRTGQTGTYAVIVTNSNNCSGSDTVQLMTTQVPSVTNNPLSKSICSGDSTDIALSSNVPGSTFHWTTSLTSGNITGFNADSGLVINQLLVNLLSTPGVVTYHITPKSGSCAGTTVNFPVTVTPGDSVKVSITASINNVCSGTPVTYTATPTNPGTTPIYQWKVNGVISGTNSTTFTYTPVNGDIVTCLLTSSITACISNNPAPSNGITMIVNPNLPVSVTISASANPVCQGAMVTFTGAPVNGAPTPIFQWKVNGINVGTNSSTYTYNPNNGDIVTCVLNSNAVCATGNPATSNAITMTVNPNLPVNITISASANPFCQGSSVTFTATPINGGGSPTYQWKVNGVNAGTNSPNYSYNPSNGDLVSCVLTSSIACPLGSPATSNTITMIVNSNLPAGVTIVASSNPFCPGSSVTFTAAPINGGTTPAYQWKVNGVNAGTNSSALTYNPANGDSVRCVMTSNLSCVTGNPASSAEIIMSGTLAPIVTFTSCFDTITTINAKPIKLKGGIPLGGTYSGPGVNSLTGIFTPSIAGVGTKTITYTYTNAAMCSANKSIHIIVQAAPVFTCGNNLTDIRDNKVYGSVQIGSQCWMASNLNFGTILASTQDQRDNCISEKYCYNDDPVNCTNQGGLYQWDELMLYDETSGDQGFCPPGWHIPTEADWNTLFANYINNGFAGSPLKYSGYSGFNALLSGMRHINKSWDFQGFVTFFWSSTAYGGYKAWAHGMNDPDPSVSVYGASQANAFSVRCVHD